MNIDRENGMVVLTLLNEDLARPQFLAEAVELIIQDEGQRRFIADLSQLHTISSLQVGAIVTLHLICYENLAVLKLANVNPQIKKVLKLVGLDKIMEMHHGVDVARQSFASNPANKPYPS